MWSHYWAKWTKLKSCNFLDYQSLNVDYVKIIENFKNSDIDNFKQSFTKNMFLTEKIHKCLNKKKIAKKTTTRCNFHHRTLKVFFKHPQL